VDGIIISPCHETQSIEAVASAARLVKVVQLDRRIAGTNTDWVGLDDGEACRLVLEHLADRGVRNVAFISSELNNSSARLRRNGFLAEVRRLGLTTRKDWIKLETYSVEWGRAATMEIFAGAERPDAIVAADDLIAMGALDACHREGIRVPEDIRITGFDNTMFSEMTTPPLTTIDQPLHQIAEEVLRRLDSIVIGDEERRPAAISLRPTLVVRQST
jgi:LacI family transcriptional regulator